MNEKIDVKLFIGPFVWNQHKNILHEINDIRKEPILIYKPNDKVKRSYVETTDEKYIMNDKCIIIYRGCGNSKYKLDFELINPDDFPNGFICENHLLVITSSNSSILERIHNSLRNDFTKLFIDLYITNGAINLNDLENNIILFDDG